MGKFKPYLNPVLPEVNGQKFDIFPLMKYPADSNGVSSANYYHPKGQGIKPLSTGGGLNPKLHYSNTPALREFDPRPLEREGIHRL
jgi:hypothetical protein